MIPTMHYLILGYRRVSTDAPHAAALLELCRRHQMIYEDFRHTPDGGISLRFPLPTARRLARLCGAEVLPLIPCEEGGLPILLSRLTRRAGLLVGLMLAILVLIFAQGVVWDIRISGNQAVSDRAIEASLEACGFGIGRSWSGFEADKTENDVLLLDDRLAWISINRKGTVAYVEVREKAPRPDKEDESPCDVVAAEGGIIQRVELEAGNVLVTAGQVVGKGDLLVSGIFDSAWLGFRLTAAKAKVYARTTRVLTVTIPLTYEQKSYVTEGDGEIRREKSVIFFKKTIKFSKKTGNEGVFCDTIEGESSWSLLSEVGFPIRTRTVWYLPYTVTTATRTYEEAEELAYLELARAIAALPGGAELLSKTITVHHGEEALTLTCTLTCIEDIGTKRPILVAEQTHTQE